MWLPLRRKAPRCRHRQGPQRFPAPGRTRRVARELGSKRLAPREPARIRSTRRLLLANPRATRPRQPAAESRGTPTANARTEVGAVASRARAARREALPALSGVGPPDRRWVAGASRPGSIEVLSSRREPVGPGYPEGAGRLVAAVSWSLRSP